MTGTTNLNLTKPTVGGDSDAWGGELNAGLDTLDSMLAGTIFGLTLSAAGSTATFGVAAGAASGMVLGSAYTKTTGSWAVGTGNGSLDTGSIANATWYHVWEIQRSDTGVVDILTSLSATSPTMPTNYDRKRRIGSMLTDDSAHWVKFSQRGNEFLWDVPVGDVAATISASAQSKTLSVPTGVQVNALIAGRVSFVSLTENALISSLDVADTSPGSADCTAVVTANSQISAFAASVRTNTSGQVRLRGSAGDATLTINTHGWIDTRGQFS